MSNVVPFPSLAFEHLLEQECPDCGAFVDMYIVVPKCLTQLHCPVCAHLFPVEAEPCQPEPAA